MKPEHYFIEIGKAILNVSSKADLFMFEGTIKKADYDEMVEDCLTLSCFYTGFFRERPPFLLDFMENKNVKEKLSAAERKESGSYFTPPYIAEYIVKETVGSLIDKIIKDKRVKDKVKKICELRICDPAMGGAIFLIEAHNYLMERLLKIDQDIYDIPQLAKMSLGTLFGVDINPKAVEFSKMVLNLSWARWTVLEKLDEYVSFAEKNLSLPNLSSDKAETNGPLTAPDLVQELPSMQETTQTKEQ